MKKLRSKWNSSEFMKSSSKNVGIYHKLECGANWPNEGYQMCFGFTCRISSISSSSWGFKQKRAEVETTNSPQDVVPSTVEVIRRRKHSSRRRIRPQITVGKSCWQFNGLDFCSVLICCCLLLSFFCPHAFHFQKDISHLSPSSLLTYMAARSIFMPVCKDTSRPVTQCTNSNPNLAHLALAAAFHQRAEGVLLANPSSSRRRRSRFKIFARLHRKVSGSAVSAHQPLSFAHSLLPRDTEHHEAARVYLGCPDLCAPSTLASLLV